MKTRREELMALLEEATYTARNLADFTDTRVCDVEDHLEHVRRSRRKTFRIVPAECGSCGFVFRSRKRLDAPSRCPKCRSERIDPPAFHIVSRG